MNEPLPRPKFLTLFTPMLVLFLNTLNTSENQRFSGGVEMKYWREKG